MSVHIWKVVSFERFLYGLDKLHLKTITVVVRDLKHLVTSWNYKKTFFQIYKVDSFLF